LLLKSQGSTIAVARGAVPPVAYVRTPARAAGEAGGCRQRRERENRGCNGKVPNGDPHRRSRYPDRAKANEPLRTPYTRWALVAPGADCAARAAPSSEKASDFRRPAQAGAVASPSAWPSAAASP
jgi:hypothetical protein